MFKEERYFQLFPTEQIFIDYQKQSDKHKVREDIRPSLNKSDIITGQIMKLVEKDKNRGKIVVHFRDPEDSTSKLHLRWHTFDTYSGYMMPKLHPSDKLKNNGTYSLDDKKSTESYSLDDPQPIERIDFI